MDKLLKWEICKLSIFLLPKNYFFLYEYCGTNLFHGKKTLGIIVKGTMEAQADIDYFPFKKDY